MIIDTLDNLEGLVPLDAFTIEGVLPYSKTKPTTRWLKKHARLPPLEDFLGTEPFADLCIAWNEQGLFIAAVVDKGFEEAFYPRFSEGDALEVFVDTRNLKEARFAHAFCHRFVFLPASVQGVDAQEITHFRTEDSHPLCPAQDLKRETSFEKNSYEMLIEIPAHCLYGFDPSSFDRMGLSYRMHRFKGKPQLFSSSTEHFSLEQQPRFWASFCLKRG